MKAISLKNRMLVIMALAFFSAAMVIVVWMGSVRAEDAPQRIVDLAHTQLVKWGKNPVIIQAVKAQNKKNRSLAQIKAMDKRWQKTPGIADYMEKMMVSECGQFLRKVQETAPFYSEIFVMDKRGANVAMTDKTTDYWQGDEAKFKKSYNRGKGAVFVDKVEFDDSSQAYLVQVSVPVEEDGKVIGTITFGIDVDQVEE